MQAIWFSRQGRDRTRNSDAAAVGVKGQHILAALVDGAEKGPQGAELARHWADVAMHALLDASSSSAVITRLKQEQAKLRHHFLHDIASYCLTSVDMNTRLAQVWQCGDCRVGLLLHSETHWLTTPHILAREPGMRCSRSRQEQYCREQQLTRCLNARRFRAPDHRVFAFEPGQTLLLSTDGYWKELPGQGTLQQSSHRRDDASLLSLPLGSEPIVSINQDADTDNLRFSPSSDRNATMCPR